MGLIDADTIITIGFYMCVAGVFLLVNGILLVLMGDIL